MQLKRSRLILLVIVTMSGLALAVAVLMLVGKFSTPALAAPIDPPEGYPKLSQSKMTVSPELLPVGANLITFTIEVINTGAYTATNVQVVDPLPANTTFQHASASVPGNPVVSNGVLTWVGTVGFDSSAVIQISLLVSPAFEGILANQASIQHASLASPVVVSAEAFVSNDPFFEISKTSVPAIPGPNKPITYSLTITNRGQQATNLPVTVTDKLPLNTSFLNAGSDGFNNSGTVTWNRDVTLATGESDQFWFSAQVGNVLSGTVLTNDQYQVSSNLSGVANGEPYTTTVLKPVLFIYKETDPFPPGSNQEVTYTLTVLNKGSLATNLQVQDTIPTGVTYLRGGKKTGNTVSWTIPSLDTGESAEVSFTVWVADVAEVQVLNNTYQVCSAESVCQTGIPLTSVIKGPTFAATAMLDPLAKKPGGGGGPVTPTLTVENLGPGNALAASAQLYFQRISFSGGALIVVPSTGSLSAKTSCGDKCVTYHWTGNIAAGEMVTFTTTEGQSTIGGEEGTHITATVVVSDILGGFSTPPITATAVATITHFANLIPTKVAPPVIGAGQVMTYSFKIWNSGLSTDTPPFPFLTDDVPEGVTVESVSDEGTTANIDGREVVSWTLPSMGPGDMQYRSYSVRVDPSLISGTLIVNDNYKTIWSDYSPEITGTEVLSNTGEPVTTIVRDVGLVDSSKTVTPTWALPGPSNVLMYVVHVANTSPVPLSGVKLHDRLPWEVSTYQRDAIASAGQVVSDIVSLDWSGSVGPLSEELITFTVNVDPGYEGAITNTAVITHSSLKAPVIVQAVAYITDDPVLQITKSASPDPVPYGEPLKYTIHVTNLGQQATELVVWDTLPANTSFVPYSASGNGQLIGDQVKWSFPVLPAGETRELSFQVYANTFPQVVNLDYGVTCHEGVSAQGEPVFTNVDESVLFLPIMFRN